MIFLVGFIVSFLAIIVFIKIEYVSSINKWILQTSHFIYYSGHPLLNDDEIFDQIKKRFGSVSGSLLIVLLKTIGFVLIIIVLVGVSSAVIGLLEGKEVPDFKSDRLLSQLFPNYLIELPFILGTLLPIVIVPFMPNKSRKEKEPYSAIDKFLHYVFLGNKNIALFTFKIELLLNGRRLKDNKASSSVYVSGMARAGTTVLMQYLGELEGFKSLSYRNLPFLFLPKTWPLLIPKKKTAEKERFHQDGIKHSLNSYEALEEPFFRNNLGEEYIKEDRIVKHQLNERIYKKYNAFRKLIAKDKIYLAKNNNHLLRAESLHQLDENNNGKTVTIIPFRNPYNQANSLLKQHKLLSELQMYDNFTLDYMDFLAHHEFGLHCKTPLLKEKNIKPLIDMDKNNIDYWLETWYLFYSQALKTFKEKDNFYFICYEDFVLSPKKTLEILLSKMNLSEELVNSIAIKKFKPVTAQNTNQNTNQNTSKYLNLYSNLRLIAINNYG